MRTFFIGIGAGIFATGLWLITDELLGSLSVGVGLAVIVIVIDDALQRIADGD